MGISAGHRTRIKAAEVVTMVAKAVSVIPVYWKKGVLMAVPL
jgi:hypothetical protein